MEVNEIHVRSKIVKISYDNDAKILHVETDLDPSIIDANFNELENRINNIEQQLNIK